MKFLSLLLFSLIFTSCGLMLENRTFLDQMDETNDQSFFVEGRDFRVAAGDSGKVGRTKDEILSRTPQSEEVAASQIADRRLNSEFQNLYNAQSDFARRHYHRYENFFNNVSERIYFLKLGSLDERNQYLMARGAPIGRNMEMNGYQLKQVNEIFLGMSKRQVISAWGRPTRIDVAGDPKYENERWAFYDGGRIRYIYFESGSVQGWTLPE